MDGQSLPTDSARAEDDCPATRLSIQTDRRDDQSAKPECCAVGLGLMADLDGRIERVGRGAGHNRSVIEQHRCRAAAIVFLETVADQRPACIHRRREIGLVHEVDLTDTTRGGQRSVAPMSRGRRERDPGPLCRPEVASCTIAFMFSPLSSLLVLWRPSATSRRAGASRRRASRRCRARAGAASRFHARGQVGQLLPRTAHTHWSLSHAFGDYARALEFVASQERHRGPLLDQTQASLTGVDRAGGLS